MNIQKRKVAIIGTGHVGSHAAYALVSQGLVDELILIDIDQAKAAAQAMDVRDAINYLPKSSVVKAGQYSDLSDAQILVIAAGPLPDINTGQSRMDTLQQTIVILDDIIAKLKQTQFSGIIVSVSNPADVVAHYLKQRLDWPWQKIFSTSTTLDSARLRRVLSEASGVHVKSIHAYVLGEHGESQMVPWSNVSIAGKSLSLWREQHPESFGRLDLPALAKEARLGGWHVLRGKGSTEFGIGISIAEVVQIILGDEKRILPLSVYLQGEYGVHDTYASVPAILGSGGIEQIIELPLTEEEKAQFLHSCQILHSNYQTTIQEK